MDKGNGLQLQEKKIMMSPFNNKLKICIAQIPDYMYLWLLIHEPRDKLLWRERRNLYMQGDRPGSFQKVEGFG